MVNLLIAEEAIMFHLSIRIGLMVNDSDSINQHFLVGLFDIGFEIKRHESMTNLHMEN